MFDLAVEKNSPSGRSKVCSILLLTADELYERLRDEVSKTFTVYQRKFDVPRQSNILSIDEDYSISRVCLFLGVMSSNTIEHVFSIISF